MRGRRFFFICIFLLSAALAPGCVKRQTTAGVVDWEEKIAIMIVKAEQLGPRERGGDLPSLLERIKACRSGADGP
jgi:hypothetical protein